MARWRLREIHCPRCGNNKREPVDIANPPPFAYRSHFDHLHVYDQTCFDCLIRPAAPTLKTAFIETFRRLKMIATAAEPNGVEH
jgi:alanine-alpha-ketoisovalerate/valine-pyruvate aminotransferase